MSKKKVITTRQIVDDDEPERVVQAAIDSDPGEASYSDFVSKFSGAQGCRVRVHRQTPRGRQYCFFGTPEEISEEAIRLFHAKQPYASEEGTYFLSVEVNGELRSSFPVSIAPQVGTPGTEASAGMSGGMAEVLRILQAQNERLEARLMQQEKAPLSEMLDSMLKLDALRGGGQKTELPIDALMKAVEIGKSLNPSAADDWNSLLISTLKDNGPMLLGMLSQILKREPAPPAQQPTVPATVPMQQPEERISESMPPNQQEVMILKTAIGFLKKKALNRSDPGLYVDLIVDNREDPLYARLIRQIVEQDFSSFVAIDADIEREPYAGFFRFIYDRIRSVFVPADTVVTNIERTDGNKTDTPPNGTGGKKRGKG